MIGGCLVPLRDDDAVKKLALSCYGQLQPDGMAVIQRFQRNQ